MSGYIFSAFKRTRENVKSPSPCRSLIFSHTFSFPLHPYSLLPFGFVQNALSLSLSSVFLLFPLSHLSLSISSLTATCSHATTHLHTKKLYSGAGKLALSSCTMGQCSTLIAVIYDSLTSRRQLCSTSHHPVQDNSGFVDSFFPISSTFTFRLRALSGSAFSVLPLLQLCLVFLVPLLKVIAASEYCLHLVCLVFSAMFTHSSPAVQTIFCAVHCYQSPQLSFCQGLLVFEPPRLRGQTNFVQPWCVMAITPPLPPLPSLPPHPPSRPGTAPTEDGFTWVVVTAEADVPSISSQRPSIRCST